MLRAVSFIVRDRNWGTYRPGIRTCASSSADGSFSSHTTPWPERCARVSLSRDVEGHADGRLVFEAQGEAATDFVTNRTGFVVLHPVEGVAGAPCTIEHVDGRKVDGASRS